MLPSPVPCPPAETAKAEKSESTAEGVAGAVAHGAEELLQVGHAGAEAVELARSEPKLESTHVAHRRGSARGLRPRSRHGMVDAS